MNTEGDIAVQEIIVERSMFVRVNRTIGKWAGGNMIRLLLPFYYNLGQNLSALNLLKPMQLQAAWVSMYQAEQSLAILLEAGWFYPAMKASAISGQLLLSRLKAQTTRNDFSSELTYEDINSIIGPLAEFETIFRGELNVADVYFVSRKGAYDTGVLITNAEACFSSELGLKIPLSIPDVREAGKCLAFELSTACGFHVLRATETVIRSYWDAVAKGKKHPRPRTIGKYADELKKHNFGNKKVIAALEQIASLHRNPLIHPDESLSVEDAIILFGICGSAIGAMLKEIPSPGLMGGGLLSYAAQLKPS